MANAKARAFYQSKLKGCRKVTTHRVLAAKTADLRPSSFKNLLERRFRKIGGKTAIKTWDAKNV